MNPDHRPDSDEPGFGQALPLLFNLVYCSRATTGVDAAEVGRLIAVAQRNNARWGITGMLAFGENIFFQWIEGPRASIERLMALLRSDTRHEQIIVLSQVEEARERLFPQWDMELVGAEQIRDVLADALTEVQDPHDARALESLVAEIDARWGSGGVAAHA